MFNSLSKRILLSITGRTSVEWKNKLLEIEKLRIKRIALFLEYYNFKERKKLYSTLLNSNIKSIPLVHIKNGMSKSELKFLVENYNSKYLTIHESSFKYLNEWKKYSKKLFVEFNYDNYIPPTVNIKKIGGFCVDLSHFKSSQTRFTKDFIYIMKKRKIKKYFKCNHLNGYSVKRKRDLHTPKSLGEFDYLKTLPKFVFGKYIAMEVFQPIKQQLKYKEYVIKLLKNKI